MSLFLKTTFIPTTSRSSSKLVPSQKGEEEEERRRRRRQQWGRWECRKKGGVHPEFYEDARVYCNGELVMTTGGTQREYSVDVWSGNHPFYLGSRSALLADADQVDKFRKRYGQLASLMEIPVLRHGEIVLPQRKKSKGKGGGGGGGGGKK